MGTVGLATGALAHLALQHRVQRTDGSYLQYLVSPQDFSVRAQHNLFSVFFFFFVLFSFGLVWFFGFVLVLFFSVFFKLSSQEENSKHDTMSCGEGDIWYHFHIFSTDKVLVSLLMQDTD